MKNENKKRTNIDVESYFHGKIPPQAQEMEKTLVAALMLHMGSMDEIVDILNPDMFYNENYKNIYQSIYSLYTQNKPIDMSTVMEELKKKSKLDNIGGPMGLIEITDGVSVVSDISYHANIIVEKSIRRSMILSCSETIRDCYNDDKNILSVISDSEVDKDRMLNSITSKSFTSNSELSMNVLRDLKIKKETRGDITGIPSGIQGIDKITSGWQNSDLIIIAARPAMGKAQPLTSKILTPKGFVTMSSIKIGDSIINSKGLISQVTKITPQGIKDVYEVIFNDGTRTRCCDDHLWEVKGRRERKNNEKAIVIPLKEIRKQIRIGSDNRLNYSVRQVDPVQYHKNNLNIDPYVLGLILGDGCIPRMSITNSEDDVIKIMNSRLPNGVVLSKNKSNGEYGFTIDRSNGCKSNVLKSSLDLYGLSNKLSKDKFIPEDYLMSDVQDRIDLLSGIVDSDGHVVKTSPSCIELSTVSCRMKDGIIDLVRSLGGRATYSVKKGRYTKNNERVRVNDYYRINISFSNGIRPFKSKKHSLVYREPKNLNRDKFIQEVNLVSREECQCISVSSDDMLYVTDDYILTHNSAFVSTIAYNAARMSKKSVAFFSLEMSEEQLMNRQLSLASEITLESFRKRNFSDYEISKLEAKQRELANLPIFWDDTPSLSVIEFRAKCRRLKQRSDLGLIIVDYLQLMTGDPGSKNYTRDQEVGFISRTLKAVAKELNVPVIALSQLSRAVDSRASKKPVLSDLRESGSIEQDADVVCFIHRPEYYGEINLPTGESTKGYSEFIIAKNRNGSIEDVEMKFIGKFTKFTDPDIDNSLEMQGSLTYDYDYDEDNPF